MQDAAAKVYFQGTMQFSPDGARLYAISVNGNGIDGSPDGVLVIDTHNWQVLDKWANDSAPVQLEQSADGRTLFVYSDSGYSNGQASALLLVDTASGATTTTLDMRNAATTARPSTLWPSIYHDNWGQAPAMAGGRARRNAARSSRPSRSRAGGERRSRSQRWLATRHGYRALPRSADRRGAQPGQRRCAVQRARQHPRGALARQRPQRRRDGGADGRRLRRRTTARPC